MVKVDRRSAISVVETYHLELTQEQAEALLVVLAKVSGCPDKSGRRHTKEISSGLRAAGVDYGKYSDTMGFINDKASGSIWFKDY